MVFLLRLCGGGGGVVGTISSSSHLTGSLLPRICMTSACCHLENFSSLRKNQNLSFTLSVPQSVQRISPPSGRREQKADQSDGAGWRRQATLPLRGSQGELTCWYNPEEVWTGLALQSGLGQWNPSPFEHEFVYVPVVGGGNVGLGRRKLKQVPPFP